MGGSAERVSATRSSPRPEGGLEGAPYIHTGHRMGRPRDEGLEHSWERVKDWF